MFDENDFTEPAFSNLDLLLAAEEEGGPEGEPDKLAAPPVQSAAPSIEQQIAVATLDTLQAIMEAVAATDSAAVRGVLIEKLSKRLKVTKKTVEKHVAEIRLAVNPSHQTPTQEKPAHISASFNNLVDLAEDDDGTVVFIVKGYNELSETYTLSMEASWEADGCCYVPPEKIHLPFLLPQACEVLEHYYGDNDHKLFQDVMSYLQRFSYLPRNKWLVLSSFVFLTYLADFDQVNYLPIILFFAEPVRGKSKTAKTLLSIAYRGVHLVDVREPNIIRLTENLHASLFFDTKDFWRKVEYSRSTDIILNRYEKGAKVPRVLSPEKGAFHDTRYFKVYGPTIIATNDPVQYVLDTRCLPIFMPNKPGSYEDIKPELGLPLKERLVAWRARMMMKESPLPEVNSIEGVIGRLADITRPLLQICKPLYPEGLADLELEIKAMAQEKIYEKKDSIQYHVIAALQELSPQTASEWTVSMEAILKTVNQKRPEQKLSSQAIGKKVKALGIQTKHVRGHSQAVLTRTELETLVKQYGIEQAVQAAELSTEEFADYLHQAVEGIAEKELKDL